MLCVCVRLVPVDRDELKRRALEGDEEAAIELQRLTITRSVDAGPLGTWALVHDLEVEGAFFSWRVKRKEKRARLPAVKGNTPKIIRIGGGYSVSPSEKTVAAQAALERLLPKPASPIYGPVRLEVEFRFEPAKSWRKARRSAALDGSVACVERTRGDLEQLVKLTNDALEARGYFPNDAAVIELDARKVYHSRQGYRIRLYRLEAAT